MQPDQRNGILLTALLAGAIWANHAAAHFVTMRDGDVRLPDLPERVGAWTGQAFNFAADPTFENYAGSRLGGRRYTNRKGETVDLFLVATARFDQFHTPEYCYICDGFALTDQRNETLAAGDRTITAKRMRAENGTDRQDVLFWFQNGDATAQHRAVIKLAALARMLEGKSPEPLVLYRFSAPLKDGGSALDRFVPGLLAALTPGEIARGGRAGRSRGTPAPL